MLIGLRKNFIFIATPKTGSTAIENHLRHHAEIQLTRSLWGKHMPLAEIEERFSWLLGRLPDMRPFVFGVIRDPVDYIVSVYNSHRKPAFSRLPQYTGRMSFEDFWRKWSEERPFGWVFSPQISRFLDKNGQMSADYIINYANLSTEWPAVCRRLDIPERKLDLVNRSPEGCKRADVSRHLEKAILDRFAPDVEALRDKT
ncbi:MAG: sulfotransferase family 2 domain-containing protein, partial [Pseudorhodoplanes sp.]